MSPEAVRLAVFHNLPSGGGIRVLSRMLDYLAGHFSVSVHFPSGSHPLGNEREVAAREWAFPQGRRLKGIRRAAAPLVLSSRLRSLDRLCRQMAQEMNRSAELVLVHNSMLVAAPPLLNYLSIPSVYFCYEYPRHIYEPDIVRRAGGGVRFLLLGWLRRLEKRMDMAAAGRAGHVVVLSSFMARRVREIYGIDPSVIRPGVDTALWRPTGEGGGKPMVLSVGALWPFKGHETVLESLSLLPSGARPGLTVVADREYPGYSRKLSSMAEGLGVSLEMRMGVSDQQLVQLYNRASAVLCCQKREPYGLVPLESMACGTPVVAVDEGGFTDNVRSGENGILVNRDPGAIAAALERLLSDEDLRKRLSDNGRLFVTGERTTEAAAAGLREILLNALVN